MTIPLAWKLSRLLAAVGTMATVWAAFAVAAPAARALAYPDVPSGHWARAAIDWVTDRGPADNRLLDDYDGVAFKPERAITRAQLARALVIASGRQSDVVDPAIPVLDVPPGHPYFHDVQVALALGVMGQGMEGFHPDNSVRAWQVDRAVVRMMKVLHPEIDWRLLTTLDPARWEPNPGFKVGAPRYLPYEIAARHLGLRFNHPSSADAEEVSPREPMPRDEVAYVLRAALQAPSWRLNGLASFNAIVLPSLSDRQRAIVSFSTRFVGYPYVWAGEYPTRDSPYGAQAHGGFDCSGFVWWVMKIHFGYAIGERSSAQMAAAAKPRIPRAKLVPGDLIFFGSNGPRSTSAQIYHAAIYLGRGWFIHSTGSADGVALASLNWDGWSWQTDFAWGRRVLRAAQIAGL